MFTGDTTGTESIYTIYEGHEIMFHISTLLPYSKDNRQQVSTELFHIVHEGHEIRINSIRVVDYS